MLVKARNILPGDVLIVQQCKFVVVPTIDSKNVPENLLLFINRARWIHNFEKRLVNPGLFVSFGKEMLTIVCIIHSYNDMISGKPIVLLLSTSGNFHIAWADAEFTIIN